MPGPKVGSSTTTVTEGPLAAASAARRRRRTWVHPDLTSHSLLVLTFEQVYLTPNAGDAKPGVVAAVEAGADLEQLLGPLAVVIDLVAVRRLRLDLQTNSLFIEYAGGGMGTSRQRVTFATSEAADACFTKLWRRLGTGLKLRDFQRNKWELARLPLAVLAGALLVTAALVLVLNVFEDFALARAATRAGATAVGPLGEPVMIPKTPLEALVGWMSWQAVCAAGGTVAAVSQVWLYRRLTTPPASLELVRSD